MLDASLVRAVQQFADLTQGVADADLDLEWAWGAYDEEGVRFSFFRTYEELRALATELAAERRALGPAMTTAQRILAQYHAAYRDLQAALLGIGAEETDRPPAEGEWPPRKIVAHIVGAELGFFGVTKYALDRHRSGDGRPAAIPDEAWDAIIGQDEASLVTMLDGPWESIRSYYDTFHERVLLELADMRDEELEAPSMYWEGYALSLRFRLGRFDSHLRQHTVQVDKTLVTIDQAPNEARRLLRLIYAALAEGEGITIGAWKVGAEQAQQMAETVAARTEEIAGILGR